MTLGGGGGAAAGACAWAMVVASRLAARTMGAVAPLKADLLLSGCDVVTIDGKNRVIPDGAVAVRGNKIVARNAHGDAPGGDDSDP